MSSVCFSPEVVEGFFGQLAAASTRLLLLDYDGTLAPFVINRDAAFPYPGVQELLEQIVCETHTRVVFVTGRRLADIGRLLRIGSTLEIWGSHGWEHQAADGTLEPIALPEGVECRLDAARRIAERLGLREQRLEVKPAGVAVHWRGVETLLAEQMRSAILLEWADLQIGGLVEMREFDGGVELRATGRTKGTVVTKMLADMVSPVVAYLGDDATDEDAFVALKGRGLGVLVRSTYRQTSADVWIQPPAGLLKFLERWYAAGCELLPVYRRL